MTILNIETSGSICSAAIGVDGQVFSSRTGAQGTNHASVLPVFISELLTELQQVGKSLDAVAISGGPGSYTGLRIGTSTAKGICYALNIPLLSIDTTQVIAAAILCQLEKESTDLGNIVLCPMIDARRMEVYSALYDTSLRRLNDIEAMIINESSFADVLEEKTCVFGGDGAVKCQSTITHTHARFVLDTPANAAYMCSLSEQRLLASLDGKGRTEDVAYYTPFYLKEFVAAPSHVKGLR